VTGPHPERVTAPPSYHRPVTDPLTDDLTPAAPATDPATPDDGTSVPTAGLLGSETEPAAEPEKRRRGRPKGSTSSSARTTRVVELCLTVSEGADGEWQAELKQGAAWISRGLPVSAAAVLKAAHELHEELAEPIEAAIGAAREARAARVAALEAELEQARKALAELEA
jgi:Family of unknown function (DUF6319)